MISPLGWCFTSRIHNGWTASSVSCFPLILSLLFQNRIPRHIRTGWVLLWIQFREFCSGMAATDHCPFKFDVQWPSDILGTFLFSILLPLHAIQTALPRLASLSFHLDVCSYICVALHYTWLYLFLIRYECSWRTFLNCHFHLRFSLDIWSRPFITIIK